MFLFTIFNLAEKECHILNEQKLPLPAYDQCLKASHVFNLLDSRKKISVAERANYISRVRDMVKKTGKTWLEKNN